MCSTFGLRVIKVLEHVCELDIWHVAIIMCNSPPLYHSNCCADPYSDVLRSSLSRCVHLLKPVITATTSRKRRKNSERKRVAFSLLRFDRYCRARTSGRERNGAHAQKHAHDFAGMNLCVRVRRWSPLDKRRVISWFPGTWVEYLITNADSNGKQQQKTTPNTMHSEPRTTIHIIKILSTRLLPRAHTRRISIVQWFPK